jgi:lysophospholipase L1-like esterase
VARFVDRYTPPGVCSADAIGRPLIDLIKALRPNVTRQNPKNRISKSESPETRTRLRYQGDANAPSVNDIGGTTAEEIMFGMRQLIERTHEHGMKIVGATIMPLRTGPAGIAKRDAVNQWIRTSRPFDGFVDFDKTISDPSQPALFQKVYDSGDNLHPNDAGHKAVGEAVDLALFR